MPEDDFILSWAILNHLAQSALLFELCSMQLFVCFETNSSEQVIIVVRLRVNCKDLWGMA